MRIVCLRLHVPHKSASDVYATLSDFERYPELSDAVQNVAVTKVSENRSVSRWEVTFRKGLLRWTEQDTFDPPNQESLPSSGSTRNGRHQHHRIRDAQGRRGTGAAQLRRHPRLGMAGTGTC
jgi:hypothetical protein